MFKKRSTILDMSKKDIKEIPFHILAQRCVAASIHAADMCKPEDVESATVNARSLVVKDFIVEYGLKIKAPWLLPHMLSVFGMIKLVKQSNLLFSPKLTLEAAFSGNSWLLGLYFLAMHNKRGDLIDAQYKAPGSSYCALVPLILAGFKIHQNIKYTSWDYKELHKIVDPKLYEAMSVSKLMGGVGVPEGLNAEELLIIRNEGLFTKTGVKAGELRSALSSYTLYGIHDSLIGELPWLAQVMLTQIWCAHPSNRNVNMILDPEDWDATPEPLISTNIFKTDKTASIVSENNIKWTI